MNTIYEIYMCICNIVICIEYQKLPDFIFKRFLIINNVNKIESSFDGGTLEIFLEISFFLRVKLKRNTDPREFCSSYL